ncbi:MAG: glycosyltransferase [Chloroflexi bacterium]|nr:glycosyltransferase [Chloroflexota bacterium]MCI0580009.1 glycosyltransferase [Chloroflexota bacterium]MCI0648466.1 glycosyltransferase [Chloroflexota bacterium]MCI0726647.1 glycosyltransferase [Chloroflexota bacterium]
MRFLFTVHPGFGHFLPMVSLARALQQAGHQVAFATARSFESVVTQARFEHIPAGLDWDESRIEETVPDIRSVPRDHHGKWIFDEIFVDRSPRQMVPDLLAAIEEWSPEAMVINNYELGGVIAAEIAGVPYANLNISFRWSRTPVKVMVGKQINQLRQAFMLPPDAGGQAYGRYLDLCLMPPTWTLPQALGNQGITRLMGHNVIHGGNGQRALAAKGLFLAGMMGLGKKSGQLTKAQGTEYYISPWSPPARPAEAPEWLRQMPAQPAVYVSLGTVFSKLYPEVFDLILLVLRDEPINLIVTLGAEGDPARFGPQPANVRLERYVPQEEILPFVDVCLNHAGYGSAMAPLAAGIPLVLLPLSADQPIIAQLCQSHGAAVPLPFEAMKINSGGLPVIDPARLTPEMIRAAVRQALTNPIYRSAAQAVAQQINALPGLDYAVQLLERLAIQRAPVIAPAAADDEQILGWLQRSAQFSEAASGD